MAHYSEGQKSTSEQGIFIYYVYNASMNTRQTIYSNFKL